ncbi:MarR family winged helix-turn-helix transcriptional regulator [Streptosporangium sp. V21-05]|uniref:MarR family winged helix-turn-helix transcriptional regulator n=1 Tax=Streptosporangium sp. V21-05 TaxID=3446115 RepID=UPI003F53611A
MSDQGRLTAVRSALFHVGVAGRAGMNVTDFNCLAVLDKDGPLTPHDLAVRIGLTRGGAITAVVDRLQRTGYVRRGRDATDRRRVLVELVRDGPYHALQEILTDVNRAYADLVESYGDAELVIIHDFAVRANEVMWKQTQQLWRN